MSKYIERCLDKIYRIDLDIFVKTASTLENFTHFLLE